MEKIVKILGFAEDGGPGNQVKGIFAESDMFDDVETHFVDAFDDIEHLDISEFDVVLLGLRAIDQTNVKRLIDRAEQAGIPVCIVDDIYNAGLRLEPEYAAKCEIFAAFEESGYIEVLCGHGYRHVVYAGTPIHWRDLYLQASSSDARSLKPKGGPLVLYAGGRFPDLNNRILQACTRGLPESAFLSYGMHPLESKIITESHINIRKGLIGTVRYIDKGEFSTAQVMGIADLVIFADGSTLTIGGALAQKPMIFYYDDQVRRNLMDIGAGNSWFMSDLGCMLDVEGVDQLAEAIPWLLEREDQQHDLKGRQAQTFPLPEEWDQPRHVLGYLRNLVHVNSAFDEADSIGLHDQAEDLRKAKEF